MSAAENEIVVLHDDFRECLSSADEFPLDWAAQLTKNVENDFLELAFHTDGATAFEKRYLESIDQRTKLANDANHSPGRPQIRFSCNTENATAELTCPYIDGEPVLEFVSRQNRLESYSATKLLLDLVTSLRHYVDYPRILSNIQLCDFVVFAEDGIRLRAHLTIASAVLRVESPRSDFRIWKFWREELTKFASTSFLFSNSESKLDRKHPFSVLTRKLSALFKSFDKLSELSLQERFTQLESLLREELQSPRGKEGEKVVKILNAFEFPRTGITKLIRNDYTALGNDDSYVLTPAQSKESFSGFVAFGKSSPAPGAEEAILYFTTPEHWFPGSVISTINQKMTSPFLKAHHNGIRIRSMTCESNFTCLVSDNEFGIPLPSLLMANSGLSPGENFLILHKIHRAISQFETAEFPLELRSPWQIQLHLDSVSELPIWQEVIRGGIDQWPAWDVRIRVETPTEHYLARSSWHSIYERLSRKFFPALTAWLFDWERFTWVNEYNSDWDAEPFNWESKMNTLIETAGSHLNEKDSRQRSKFLELAKEVVSSTS